MIIHLGNPTRAEVISSVLGQLSDGIWENSSAMDRYWMFADVDGTDLDISDKMYDNSYSYYRNPVRNGFYGKSEKEIKDWFANKAKQVVKIWAEDYGKDPKDVWDRNNTDEVTYMGHHRMDVTVADVYECYDFLKGRSGKKYGITEEPTPVEVEEVSEPKVSGGMNPSQQEVEDFFLDASINVKCGTKYPKGYVKAYRDLEWDGWVKPKWILDYSSDVPNMKEAKKLASYIHVNEYTSGFATPEEWFDYYDIDEIYQEMLDTEN